MKLKLHITIRVFVNFGLKTFFKGQLWNCKIVKKHRTKKKTAAAASTVSNHFMLFILISSLLLFLLKEERKSKIYSLQRRQTGRKTKFEMQVKSRLKPFSCHPYRRLLQTLSFVVMRTCCVERRILFWLFLFSHKCLWNHAIMKILYILDNEHHFNIISSHKNQGHFLHKIWFWNFRLV